MPASTLLKVQFQVNELIASDPRQGGIPADLLVNRPFEKRLRNGTANGQADLVFSGGLRFWASCSWASCSWVSSSWVSCSRV